jgi:hypothetical protein
MPAIYEMATWLVEALDPILPMVIKRPAGGKRLSHDQK